METEGFVVPDWQAPLELEARLAQVPPALTNKGILLQGPVQEVLAKTGRKVGRDYAALADYPVTEHIRVMCECAALLYPGEPPRQGLRLLGRQVLPRLKANPAGRLLFSVAAGNLFGAVKLIGRAYALFTSTRATATIDGEARILVELRTAWIYPDALQVGVYEGATAEYGRACTGGVKLRSPCDVYLGGEVG